MPPRSAALQPSATRRVRPADVADEQRVAGQHRGGRLAVRRVVEDQQRNRLRRVPGGGQRAQPHLAQVDLVAVGERREGVLRRRLGAQVDAGAGAVAQLEVSGEEVGVQVREHDVPDRQAVFLRVGQVLVDVALRVHDHRPDATARRPRRRTRARGTSGRTAGSASLPRRQQTRWPAPRTGSPPAAARRSTRARGRCARCGSNPGPMSSGRPQRVSTGTSVV